MTVVNRATAASDFEIENMEKVRGCSGPPGAVQKKPSSIKNSTPPIWASAGRNIYSHGITKLEGPSERHRKEYADPLGLSVVWGWWL
jgi:hypothetical protein